jgi:quercetin dioxygenase-like cupin family protein
MKLYKSGSGEEIKKQDYSKIVLFDQSQLPTGHFLQIATIPANTKQRLHYHDVQTAVVYILQGRCTLHINNQDITLSEGDAVVCEPGDKHYFHNQTGQDFTFLVFKINLPEQDDTHWEKT